MKKPIITSGIFLFNTLTKKILICHPTHASWNQWSLPKGIKNPGEESFEAASRELKEETGIDLFRVNIIEKRSLPAVKYKKQNKILESFLVITDSDLSKHKLSCSTLIDSRFPEIDDWKWIALKEMKNYLHESQQKHFETLAQNTKKYS